MLNLTLGVKTDQKRNYISAGNGREGLGLLSPCKESREVTHLTERKYMVQKNS